MVSLKKTELFMSTVSTQNNQDSFKTARHQALLHHHNQLRLQSIEKQSSVELSQSPVRRTVCNDALFATPSGQRLRRQSLEYCVKQMPEAPNTDYKERSCSHSSKQISPLFS